MSIPIPVGPIVPLASPTFIPFESKDLNLTADTLLAYEGLSSASSSIDSRSPRLDILGFSTLLSSITRAQKQEQQDFLLMDSLLYKNVRINKTKLADYIRDQITIVSTLDVAHDALRLEALALVDDFNAAVNNYNRNDGPIDRAVRHWANVLNDFGAIVSESGKTNPDLGNISNWLNDMVSQMTMYANGDSVNPFPPNQAVAAFNQTLLSFQARFTTLNQKIDTLNASLVVINDLAEAYNPTNGSPYQVPLIPKPSISYTLPRGIYTPADPNFWASVDPATPQSFYYANNLYNTPVISYASTINRTQWGNASEISSDNLEDYILKPLVAALKLLDGANERVNRENIHQDYQRLDFGQVTTGMTILKPVGKETTVGGTGSSTTLATLSADQSQNVFLQSTLGKANLDAVYGRNGVAAGSPITSKIDGFVSTFLQAITAKSLDAAADLTNKGIKGGTVESSPVIDAALAVSFLEQAQAATSSTAINEAILNGLLADPNFANVPVEQLKVLADNIASAVKLDIIQVALLQVSKAFALTGLIPQLLAGIGTPSSETIAKFNLGPVKYAELYQNPLELAAASTIIKDSLVSSGFSEEAANNALQQAISDQAKIQQARSDAQAKDQYRDSIRRSLENQGSDPAAAQSAADKALTQVEDQNQQAKVQDRISNDIKQVNFQTELKAAVTRSTNDRDEANRISNKIVEASRSASNLDEVHQAAKKVLNAEGFDNADELVDNSASKASSPLVTAFPTQTASLDDLRSDLNTRVSNLFASQGVPADLADNTAVRLTDVLLGKSTDPNATSINPNSIRTLIETNLKTYAAATQQTNFDAAVDNFKESIRPTLSTEAFLNLFTDNTKKILLAVSPLMGAGAANQKIGTGGGVDIVNQSI